MKVHHSTREKVLRMFEFGFKLRGIARDTGLTRVQVFRILLEAELVIENRPELYDQ